MKSHISKTVAILLLSGITAQGATVSGIDLPADRDGLELHGAGLLRKGLFFRIYVGALYLEEAAHADDVLEDVPKRIDIQFFHNTPKTFMVREANAILKKNLSPKQLRQLEVKIDRLHQAYLNGKKGSFASIIYRPGEGLTYLFDDESIITIPCDDFANAYFSIWLGERPSSRSIKRAMLEGKWS